MDLFAALAHQTRLRCLMLLMVYDELCVCDLTQVLDVAQPHMSRHLAQLRALGLVSDRRDGLWIHYRLTPQLPDWVVEILAAAQRGTEAASPFCDDLAFLARRFSTIGSYGSQSS